MITKNNQMTQKANVARMLTQQSVSNIFKYSNIFVTFFLFGLPDYHVADENVSTGSCCSHYDVDDRKRPQNVVPKSESFYVSFDDQWKNRDGDDDDEHDQHDQHDDDLCAPMHASIHPNSSSGSMSELRFDLISDCSI